jgi:hypothetical protein
VIQITDECEVTIIGHVCMIEIARVVDRRRADRDLHGLRDIPNSLSWVSVAVTANVNSPINRGFEFAALIRLDDCCERLAVEHELT